MSETPNSRPYESSDEKRATELLKSTTPDWVNKTAPNDPRSRISETINIRLYESGDEKGIVELLKLAFSNWVNKSAPSDYWNWKYLDCPLPSLIAVADHRGKITSVDHYVRLNVKIGTSILDCYYGDDAVTHPDYRGRGLYNKINLYKDNIMRQNGIKISFAFTTSPTVVNENHRKGRLEFPHRLSSMLRVRDVDQFFKVSPAADRLILGSGLKTLKSLNRVNRVLASKKKIDSKLKLEEITHFDNSVETFWSQIEYNYNLIFERSVDYLNWRYCDPRAGNIRVTKVMDEVKMLGYIVTEIRKSINNVDQGYILDLLTLPNRQDAADVLMQKACNYFDEHDINSIQYKFIHETTHQNLASSYGFVDKSIMSKNYFLWQFKGAENEYNIIKASLPERLHFVYGDYL